MAELALREDNAPFSGLGFPYAGIEAAVGAAKQVDRGLSGIARKNAVSLRAVEPRLRQRVLEADNMGFADGLAVIGSVLLRGRSTP
jgi:hypothetical protein